MCVRVFVRVTPPDQTKDDADPKFGTYTHSRRPHTHAPLEYNQKLFSFTKGIMQVCDDCDVCGFVMVFGK